MRREELKYRKWRGSEKPEKWEIMWSMWHTGRDGEGAGGVHSRAVVEKPFDKA